MKKSTKSKEYEKELRELAPSLLNNKWKEESLDAPEGYFEQLPEQIWQNIESNNHEVVDLGSNKSKRWLPISIAASLLVLVCSYGLLSSKSDNLETVTIDELMEFVINHPDELDDNTLSDYDILSEEIVDSEFEDEELDYLINDEGLYELSDQLLDEF